MSILIEGMEMPKTPVLFCVHPDGKVFADLEGNWREYKAVPVPEHGRLGDLDVILKKCEFVCTDDDVDVSAVRYSVIDAAPTVIPADEVV